MHCLQHSADDIVKNRLPVKMLFCSEHSNERRQLMDLIHYLNVFLLRRDCRLSLVRIFYDTVEDLPIFYCIFVLSLVFIVCFFPFCLLYLLFNVYRVYIYGNK